MDAYRKLRNTFRYLLGNLSDFDPAHRRRARRRNGRRSTSGFCCAPKTWWPAAAPGTTNFEFHKVYHAVYDFATVDLSAVYFDVLKDRLYTSATKSHARRSAQTALYRLLDALVRLLAPHHELHRRRGLGATWAARTACTSRYFPEPSELTAGLDDAAANAPQTGTVSWK